MALPVLALGPILKAVGKALQAVPWRAWIALGAFLALALAFWLYGERKADQREEEVRSEWAESIARGKRRFDELKAQRDTITVKTETVYVDRIRVVREKGQTLIQRIPALVPADACLLPAGWRLSHNHAAAGTVPDTADGADAGAAGAEGIAWRPWNSRAGAAGRDDGGRELQPVSPARRTAARLAGVDSRAGGR